jgi:hypothetical protein
MLTCNARDNEAAMFVKMKFGHTLASATLAVAALLATGCTATVSATPARARVLYSYPVVRVESAPVRVYESPRVYYHGRPAYLVGGRWYYPADDGWVYFSREPRELRIAREKRAYSRVEPRATRRRYADPPRRYVEPPRERQRRRYE